MTTRDEINSIIKAALLARRADFAQTIANDWLASWPGDLQVQLLLAQAEIETGSFNTVRARLMEIITILLNVDYIMILPRWVLLRLKTVLRNRKV